jgi:hypothetical protein
MFDMSARSEARDSALGDQRFCRNKGRTRQHSWVKVRQIAGSESKICLKIDGEGLDRVNGEMLKRRNSGERFELSRDARTGKSSHVSSPGHVTICCSVLHTT